MTTMGPIGRTLFTQEAAQEAQNTWEAYSHHMLESACTRCYLPPDYTMCDTAGQLHTAWQNAHFAVHGNEGWTVR